MSGLFTSLRRASNPQSEDALNEGKERVGPSHKEIYLISPDDAKILQRPPYTKQQETLIKQLDDYAHTLLLPKSDPYYPWELRFISDPTFAARYGRASKFNLQDGKHRIQATLEWRREYKPDLIKPSEVSKEAETGKLILNGFDVNGRPILYMRPGRENTEPSPRQIRFLIYLLERAIDMMPPGQESLVIIVDYASASTQDNPSVSTARKVLHILQAHYVERMGRAIVVKTPWWVNAFFTAVSPFLDPVTRDKLRFNPKLLDLIHADQLDADYGGDNNYEFDFKLYWNGLIDFCHLSQDGTRLGPDGKPAMPPAGKGAHWANEYLKTQGSSKAIEASTETHEILANGHPPPAYPTHDAQSPTSTVIASPRGSLDGVPVIATKPGPPASGVFFDHPPSEQEKRQAKQAEAASA